jgi:hypothetical protein
MRIFDKWKFADIYVPSKNTVIIVTTYPHPVGWLTERARFFKDRCNVYELDGDETTDYLSELIDKLK